MAKNDKKQEPFLPMFCGDFFAATAEWDGEEEGLYALLLMRQWSIGHLPADIPKLARLVKFDQRTFERWWPNVSVKFERITVPGFGSRLINSRLEIHRAKAKALSEKNSASGKKGAETKWRKDSERHVDETANASKSNDERQKIGMASGIENNGERHQSAIATTDGNLSHPIPSHPNPSQLQDSLSSQAPDVRTLKQGAGELHEFGKGREETSIVHLRDDDYRLSFDAIKDAYPAFTAGQDWLKAEHHWRHLLDDGCHLERELLGGVERYAAYVKAKGVSGPGFVMTPGKFFGSGEKYWAQAWEPPAEKSADRIEENIAAGQAWLASGGKS